MFHSLQYLYYEKVRPKGALCMSRRPLMRNWTETAAEKRDGVDYVKGRGKGMVNGIDCILSLLVFSVFIISCGHYYFVTLAYLPD